MTTPKKKDHTDMRYGSVCSGVEAASLAWRHLGWEPAFFSEVEPFPAAVLMQRLGATKPLRPLDPATDMQSGAEKSLRRFESKVLRLRIRVARGEKISFLNRFVMWLYGKARKLSIIPEMSAESLTQFAVEEVIRNEELSMKQQIVEPTTHPNNEP